MICAHRQETFSNNSNIFSVMGKITSNQNDLKKRLSRAGLQITDLQKYLGLTYSSANRLVNGNRKITVEESVLIDNWLTDVANSNEPQEEKPRKIPLYGYAAGNNGDRVAFLADRALDWLDPPPYAPVNGEIVAIRIIGDSMEPRLFAGEEVYIAKDLSPARGKDCVIEFKDGTAMVKTYLRSRDGVIYCQQYNPDKEIAFKYDEIKQLHAVIWRR